MGEAEAKYEPQQNVAGQLIMNKTLVLRVLSILFWFDLIYQKS